MKLLKTLLIVATGICSSYSFANNDIVGQWRNIDDKTGFSKGIVEISQNSDGTYSGKVIDITPRPGYTPKTVCDKCKGANKDKPIIGLQILKNAKRSPTNNAVFINGTLLDPLSGNEYKSTLRLNPTGSRLAIRGFVGVEALGRSQTWIRQE